MRIRRFVALAVLAAAVLGGGTAVAVAATGHHGGATEAGRGWPYVPPNNR